LSTKHSLKAELHNLENNYSKGTLDVKRIQSIQMKTLHPFCLI